MRRRKRMLKRMDIFISLEIALFMFCVVGWFFSYYICFKAGKWVCGILSIIFGFNAFSLGTIREEIFNEFE